MLPPRGGEAQLLVAMEIRSDPLPLGSLEEGGRPGPPGEAWAPEPETKES